MKGVAAVLLVLFIAHSVVASFGLPVCKVVWDALFPCTKFAISEEAGPTKECRDAVHSFRSKLKLKATKDKRSVCKCFKQVDIVTNLLSKCGAPLPIPITKDMDCDEIE